MSDELKEAHDRIEVLLLAERDLAALRSLASDLAGALERVEWAQKTTRLKNGGTIYTAITCPSCGGEKDPPPGRRYPETSDGHQPGCELAAVLTRWREYEARR